MTVSIANGIKPWEPSFGLDPEFQAYLRDDLATGVPFIGKIPGDKAKPHPIGDGFSIQLDGVAMEFCTPVVQTPKEFADVIEETVQRAQAMCAQVQGSDVVLSMKSHQSYKDLREWPEAMIAGCDADTDVYTNAATSVPEDLFAVERYSAGHVHIGHPDWIPSDAVCRIVDHTFFSHYTRHRIRHPLSPRNLFYGRPGVYRSKPYGTEYRTPGTDFLSLPRQSHEILAHNCTELIQWIINSPDDAFAWYERLSAEHECRDFDVFNELYSESHPVQLL